MTYFDSSVRRSRSMFVEKSDDLFTNISIIHVCILCIGIAFQQRFINRDMEWSKVKTLKLIELLQMNATLWNPSLCDTRRDKQKRREEMRAIANIFGISIPDAAKKIQHLRTQYNRESAREARALADDPNDRYISNWYAFEYLHFLKDSSKPYRVLHWEENRDVIGSQSDNSGNDCHDVSLSPPLKIARTDNLESLKPEIIYPATSRTRDEFTVFGEYVANELRSLKGEKNLLVAKKKIQDIIFEVKMGMICEQRAEYGTVFAHSTQSAYNSGKLYTPVNSPPHIEPLPPPHTPPTTGISEIIINGTCHYSNFKEDTQ